MIGPTLSGPKHRIGLLELYEKLEESVKPSTSQYNAFHLIGKIPAAKEAEVVDYVMKDGLLATYLTDEQRCFIDDLSGKFVVSKSTRETLDISVRKMDNYPTYDFMAHAEHYIALDMVEEIYWQALTATPYSVMETLGTIDETKSPGVVLVKAGYRTKRDVISYGFLQDFYDPNLVLITPYWKACGKVEIRSYLKYVVDKSQRTFIVEPFELLFHHKRLFGRQNEQMKMVEHSYYGFNPYEGGANELGQKLSRFRRKWMWDVVKWDRLMPHLKSVYDIKLKFLKIFGEDQFLNWVVHHNIVSRLVLPNGDVIEKQWGNNSGSGTTTVDNILGMLIIIYHIFLVITKGNIRLARQLAFCAAFGDDVVGGDNFDISDEEFSKIVVDTFQLYGLKLDPLIITRDVEDLSFLGFSFSLHDGVYIPKYDIARLSAAFYKVQGKELISAEMSKMFSLMLMSAGNGRVIYDSFRAIINHILINCRNPDLDLYRKMEVPTYTYVINWYKGLECSSSFSKFFEEFGDVAQRLV